MNDRNVPELDHILRNRQKEFDAHDLTISAAVLESWRRSVLHGLNPSSTAPRKAPASPGASLQLVECAARVVDKRLDDLTRSAGVLSLTDAACVILRQWRGDNRLYDKLRENDVGPGYLVAEGAIGTSSGITLLSRAPEMVRGPEHFAEQFRDVSSAGMVIVHPVSGHVVGSLHLTNRFAGTSPLALNWVLELVKQIEGEMVRASSKLERLLMASFLEERRDVRHAVIAVNEHTVISNAAAARLLGQVDQTLLWALASRVTSDSSWSEATVEMGNDLALQVQCRAIREDSRLVGAILRLAPPRAARLPRSPNGSDLLPGLAGHCARWRAVREQLADAGAASLMLVGERGVGKLAIARALSSRLRTKEIDADDAAREGCSAWRTRLEELASTAPECLIVGHIDRIAGGELAAIESSLHRISRDVRIITTALTSPCSEHDGESAIVTVPALRDRIADLPDLVNALTVRWLSRTNDRRKQVIWTTDALKALSRIDWSANIASLAQLVERVLGTVNTEYVGARELPADVVLRASKRRLTGLERVEANAILQAIHDANGNRYRAAKILGIARSTLYRKMCALGLDLESSTF